MKKVLNVFILFLFALVNVYGQFIERKHTTKSEIYNTISDIPFLNTDRVISIKDWEDSKRLRSLNKKYIKIMKAVVTAKNEKELAKANRKALAFFEGLEDKGQMHGIYQLGHYYAFGVFDPYFDGDAPSNIERTGLSPIDKDKARKYFENDKIKINKQWKGIIQLIPNTWYYDVEQGLVSVLSGINESENCVKIVKYLEENKCNFNPQRVCRYCHDFCDYCDTDSILPIAFISLLYAIEQLPTTSPIREQLCQNLNADEIAALALSYDKSNKSFEALYYGALAMVRGNANGFVILVDKWRESLLSHYKNHHPEHYKAGIAHSIISIKLWSLEYSLAHFNINNFKQILDNFVDYHLEIAEELGSNYTAEQKAKKEARRREIWQQLGLAFAESLQQTSAQMSNYYIQSSYANMGNFNSLLDPRLAAMQVNAQEYAEFQEFSRYNKREDGSNYSFDEFKAFKGQALLNLKEQGIDLVAGQKELNTKLRQQMREERAKDTERRFKEMGYDYTSHISNFSNSSTNTKNNSSNTTNNKINSTSVSDQTNILYSTEKELDSNEQYRRDPVASEDYQEIRKDITLYYRDGDKAIEYKRNVTLYKKGSNYYIKIDNTFYPRRSPNWLRFSNMIHYREGLYYNY